MLLTVNQPFHFFGENQINEMDIIEKYIGIEPDKVTFQEICDDLLLLSGSKYTVFNKLTDDKKYTQTLAHSGAESHILKASELFGFNILDKKWEIDQFAAETMSSNKVINRGSLLELSAKHIPMPIAKVITTIFGVGDIYSVGVFSDEIIVGTFVMILPKNGTFKNQRLVEVFAKLIGSLIYQKNKNIQFEKNRLNTKKLAHIIDSTSESIKICDINGNLVYLNNKATERLGVKLDGINVYNIFDFDSVIANKTEWEELLIKLKEKNNIIVEGVHFNKTTGAKIYVEVTFKYNNIDSEEYISIISRDLTEKKKQEQIIVKQNNHLVAVEEELRASIEQLSETNQQFVEQNNELNEIINALDESSLVSVADEKGIIIKVNKTFCEISKYSENELIGKNHNIVNSSYHSKEFWQNMWNTIKAGKAWKGEVKNKAKDGNEYWVSSVINPIFDSKGKIKYYLSIRQDITARKLYETELEKVKKQLDEIINNVDSAMWSMDTKGDYLFMNEATERLTGYTIDDFLNTPEFWKQVVVKPNNSQTIIKKLLKDVDNAENAVQIRTKEGELKWLLLKKKEFKYNDKLLRVDVIATDITKLIEDRIQLASQNEYINTIIKTLPDTLFRVNNNFEFTYCHTNNENQLYVKPEDFLGKVITDVLPPDLAIRIQKIIIHTLDTGQINSLEYLLEVNENLNWYEARISKINNEEVLCVIRDITERKIAEQQLKESESNLKEAEQIAQIGRWELDLVFNKLSWSDTVFEIFNVDKDIFKATYEGFVQFIHPDDREKVSKAYLDSLENKLPYSVEHRIVLENGEIKWLRETCRTDYEEGNAIRSVGIVQDITSVKLPQLELEKTKEQLEETGKISRIGGWEFLIEDFSMYWSKITKEIFEVDSKIIPSLDKTFSFFTDIEQREQITKCFENAIDFGIPWEGEYEIETAKNNFLWVKIIGHLENINNRCVRIYGTIQDISNQKLQEKIQQEYINKIIQSTLELQNYRKALDQSAIIAITDTKGVITYANRKFEEVSGYTSEELIGKTHKIVNSGLHEKHFWKEFWLKLNSKESWKGIIINRKKSGDLYWVDTTITPMLDDKGEVMSFFAIRFEITENELNKQGLEEKNRVISEIHHRIKNNLQVVKSLLSMQRMRSHDESIKQNLLDTENRIMAMAVVHESIYKNHNADKLNLKTYLEDFIPVLAHSYLTLGIKINTQFENIFMESNRIINIGIIFNELVSNTSKYAFDKQNNENCICIETSTNNNEVVIYYSDNGKGMDSNKKGGNSLGLGLILGLVKQLKGSVKFIEKPGFHIEIILPLG